MPTQSAPPFGTMMTTEGMPPRQKPDNKQIRIKVVQGPNSANDLADAIVTLCAQWQEKRGEKLDVRVIGDALRLAQPKAAHYFRNN